MSNRKIKGDPSKLDVMFTKNPKKAAAGRLGGLKKVKKGFATLDPEIHRERSSKGGKVGKKVNDLKGKDLAE